MTAIFGNGTSLAPKNLVDLEVGDEIVICDRQGNFTRTAVVRKKTARCIWTGANSSYPRFDFEGNQINGRGHCRIPTRSDKQRIATKRNEEQRRQKEEQRLASVRSQEQYRLAKEIGFALQDADQCNGEDEYLAFVNAIGLTELTAFVNVVRKALNRFPRKRKRARHRYATND